jgi:hypothetical protein
MFSGSAIACENMVLHWKEFTGTGPPLGVLLVLFILIGLLGATGMFGLWGMFADRVALGATWRPAPSQARHYQLWSILRTFFVSIAAAINMVLAATVTIENLELMVFVIAVVASIEGVEEQMRRWNPPPSSP